MNENITREEKTERKFTLVLKSNNEYLQFVKALGRSDGLSQSKILMDLYDQEFNRISDDPVLMEIYSKIV